VVINLIKGLKDKQSPEGQQRIDQVIVEIEKAEHPSRRQRRWIRMPRIRRC